MGTLVRRLRYLLFRSHHEAELLEEIEAHRALRQWQLGQDSLAPWSTLRRSRHGYIASCRDRGRQAWAAVLARPGSARAPAVLSRRRQTAFFCRVTQDGRFTVVGVVGEVKLKGVVGSQTSFGAYYFPYAQRPGASRFLTLAVRTSNDGAASSTAMRRVITGLDRELPLFDVQTLVDRSVKSLGRQRALMVLSLSFPAVALSLTAIGIYGVLSYPLVLTIVGGVLLFVAVIACVVPARRAAHIDPLVALTE
jgi:hypothetical protein